MDISSDRLLSRFSYAAYVAKFCHEVLRSLSGIAARPAARRLIEPGREPLPKYKSPPKSWFVSKKLAGKLLWLAERAEHLSNKIHAKWRNKMRCAYIDPEGSQCILAADSYGHPPHFTETEYDRMLSVRKEDNKRPFHLAYGKEMKTFPYLAWLQTKWIPIHIIFDDDSVAGSHVIAFARVQDVWAISNIELKTEDFMPKKEVSSDAE